MKFFSKIELEKEFTKMRNSSINKIVKEHSEENKVLKRLNSILKRKDIINLDNDKIDALRLLAFHFEDNKGMSAARLVKFLKK